MPRKCKTFCVGSLSSLCVLLESSRQWHSLYARKKVMPHYDYIIIFHTLLKYFVSMSYISAAKCWPSLQQNYKLPIFRKKQQLIQQMGVSSETHQPTKYYRIRTLFKASYIPLSRAYSWIIRQLCAAFFYRSRVLWQGISTLNVVKYLQAEHRKSFFFVRGLNSTLFSF